MKDATSKTIMHIISGLNKGGAEKILYELVTNTQGKEIRHCIVSLSSLGYYGKEFLRNNIPVHVLSLKANCFKAIYTLYKIIKSECPVIISSWMYHADFLAMFLKICSGRNYKVIWNIHNTTLKFKEASLITILIRKLCAIGSFLPDYKIFCAEASLKEHIRVGYVKRNNVVVHNGYDEKQYYYDIEKRTLIRNKYAIKQKEILIANVARVHPQKGQTILLEAFRIACNHLNNLKLVLVGAETNSSPQIQQFIYNNKLSDKIICLGICDNVAEMYSAFDIFILSSITEAFPNVIAEAMLSELPCISTDVGDVSLMMGGTGLLVPIKDSVALSKAIISIGLESNIHSLGVAGREQIIQNFSLEKMCNAYLNIYKSLI